MKREWVAGLLMTVQLASAALAHHSFAMFDMTKTVELAGTIKEVQWKNPHVWIQIVHETNAGTEEWGFEGGPTGTLKKMGLTRNSLRPGDKVTITTHPLRNGDKGGALVGIKDAGGKTIFYDHFFETLRK